jgi:hypothetical protein
VNGSRQIVPETEDRTTFEVSKNFEMFNRYEPQRWKLTAQFSSHETVVGETFWNGKGFVRLGSGRMARNRSASTGLLTFTLGICDREASLLVLATKKG